MNYINRFALACLCLFFFSQVNAESPGLLHAGNYTDGIQVREYWVSEKLDGIRGYWNGKQLLTRQGKPINAPGWFTEDFPKNEMDGELWIGRNRFEQVASTVLDRNPDESQWREVKYMLFDLPHSPGSFSQRLETMKQLVRSINRPQLQSIPQFRVENRQQLLEKLDEITRAGGEGLMLHHESAVYRDGRSDALLKLKQFQDAEAKVIAHLPGKGKFRGMMGSLLVENSNNKRFRIGSGFTLLERQNPPPPGAIISYKYYGLTKNGIPKFASYLRIRPAE